MSDERTIQVDEVEAAINIEVSRLEGELEKLKAVCGAMLDEMSGMADHMNRTFTSHHEAIRECQEKHNRLALMFTALVEQLQD